MIIILVRQLTCGPWISYSDYLLACSRMIGRQLIFGPWISYSSLLSACSKMIIISVRQLTCGHWVSFSTSLSRATCPSSRQPYQVNSNIFIKIKLTFHLWTYNSDLRQENFFTFNFVPLLLHVCLVILFRCVTCVSSFFNKFFPSYLSSLFAI